MRYQKPHLTYEQQAELLLSRGLVADKQRLIECLQTVNYYRLSAYWFPFKQADDNLQPGTTLDIIWQRYSFDRQLRILLMDAIEGVEVVMRTSLAYELTRQFGAFAHLDPRCFPNIDPREYQRLKDDLHKLAQDSREVFVEHFRTTYDEFPDLPLWAAVEIMTFGQMFTVFRHSGMHVQRDIAKKFSISGKVLFSWLLTLNYVRNLCAHHARLWNRELAIKPIFPDIRHEPRWYAQPRIENRRLFSVLTVLRYLSKHLALPGDLFAGVNSLLSMYPEIPRNQMGIPDNWQTHPLWV